MRSIKFSLKSLVINALICALYFLLSLIGGNFAFSGLTIQLRFSELLNLLIFFNPSYILGVTLGCFLTNLLSMYGILDLIIGTLATLISGIFIIIFSKFKKLWLVSIFPIIINAFIVPFVIVIYSDFKDFFISYSLYFINILIGEFISILIGYIILMILRKSKTFLSLINGSRNLDFRC